MFYSEVGWILILISRNIRRILVQSGACIPTFPVEQPVNIGLYSEAGWIQILISRNIRRILVQSGACIPTFPVEQPVNIGPL